MKGRTVPSLRVTWAVMMWTPGSSPVVSNPIALPESVVPGEVVGILLLDSSRRATGISRSGLSSENAYALRHLQQEVNVTRSLGAPTWTA